MIMAYAAKYASRLLRPVPRRGRLQRHAQGRQAHLSDGPGQYRRGAARGGLDIAEGADMVMVKPGMPYLDICRRVADTFRVPTFAYQVSGEYAMLTAAAERGWLDGERVMMESLIAFKRAGCARRPHLLRAASGEAARRVRRYFRVVIPRPQVRVCGVTKWRYTLLA